MKLPEKVKTHPLSTVYCVTMFVIGVVAQGWIPV